MGKAQMEKNQEKRTRSETPKRLGRGKAGNTYVRNEEGYSELKAHNGVGRRCFRGRGEGGSLHLRLGAKQWDFRERKKGREISL